MLLRHLEGLINTLTNSDTWHDDDKFAPAIPLVKLVHGLNICIGFADTCFHLNCQVKAAIKRIGRFYTTLPLNGADMLKYFIIGNNNRCIAEARKILCLG